MPLVPPITPDALRTKQALRSGLPDFVNPRDPLAVELAHGDNGLPVAILAVQDLLNGSSLASAHAVGWGFYAGMAGGPAVAAQVSRPAPDQAAVLTSFSRGPEIAALIQSIHDVEGFAQVQASDYELWVLRIPGILVESFWLKPRSGAPDLIVPFHTLSKQFTQMHAYTWGEFLAVAQPLAEKFQDFDKVNPDGQPARKP